MHITVEMKSVPPKTSPENRHTHQAALILYGHLEPKQCHETDLKGRMYYTYDDYGCSTSHHFSSLPSY